MQRRDFILKTASLAVAGLSINGCTGTATTTTTGAAGTGATPPVSSKRRQELDSGATSTLARLETEMQGSRELIAKASATLVFPSVIAAGFGIGGQYGEGVLRPRQGKPEYYSLASISAGLQIGAQSKAMIFLFMTQEALDKFRQSEGWTVGADASVALLKVGANGMIDTSAANGPVLAFVLTNVGLMANLTLEGTKITRLKI